MIKLINELAEEDKRTKFHLLQHRTYLEFANMFEEDRAELHRLRQILIQLAGSQGLLIKRIKAHQLQATLQAHKTFNSISIPISSSQQHQNSSTHSYNEPHPQLSYQQY